MLHIILTMRTLFLLSSFLTLFFPSVPHLQVANVDVDAYVSKEGPIAKAGLLANIGASGSKAGGVTPGIVRLFCHIYTINVCIDRHP